MKTSALRLTLSAALVLVSALALSTAAAAQSVTPVEPAGYIVYPRIVSDPSDLFNTGTATNTVVQLTNVSSADATVHCIYVNATGTCSTGVNVVSSIGAECRVDADCVGALARCNPQWSLSDFTITLSPQQPTGWVVDEGLTVPAPGDGAVPPVNLDYFVGELKCIHVDNNVDANPVNANVLIGEASIYDVTSSTVDVRSYSAIGVQSIEDDGSVQGDKTLCLGGSGQAGDVCEVAEYASCAPKLVLGHFFEGAQLGGLNSSVSTQLTLTPCSNDFVTAEPTSLVAQYLVFNEFEQRMSASSLVRCTETTTLSDISNIFNVSIQGTLSGQTHIRPVSADGPRGLLGIAEEFIGDEGSAAYHVNQLGEGSVDSVSYVFPTN